MNSVNKTLYIPLYGKALVSSKGIILSDKKAEEIWQKEGFRLSGKAKSKWLAYYMAMRSALYDEWLEDELASKPDAVVLHIGCGMDSRVLRVKASGVQWYDIDFAEVIEERRKYFCEGEYYHMLGVDMKGNEWKECIAPCQDAIAVIEGVSMYFEPEKLTALLSSLSEHFRSVKILMDCYSERAARLSKIKNPIKGVGVKRVYGYDDPRKLADLSNLIFLGEKHLMPQKYIDELKGAQKALFKRLYAGKIAKSLYKAYEFKK